MLDAALLIGGLALLTFAADKFVDGSVDVATILRVPVVIVGAIIIGFGTSAPELLVSALASLDGKQDIALGNIVGSNTTNLLLVVGASAALATLPITVQIWRREIRLMFLAVGLLIGVSWDRRIETWEGIVLLVAAVAAIGLMTWWGYDDRSRAVDAELEEEIEEEFGPARTLPRAWLVTILGLLGTLAGAQMLVDGASGVAAALGLSEAVIGLTVVAIGTSLPELVTAVAAARHGEKDLIIGNVVGSNIFNSLPVAGLSGLLDTTTLDRQFTESLTVLAIATVVFAIAARRRFLLTHMEGALLLLGFVAATAVAF